MNVDDGQSDGWKRDKEGPRPLRWASGRQAAGKNANVQSLVEGGVEASQAWHASHAVAPSCADHTLVKVLYRIA